MPHRMDESSMNSELDFAVAREDLVGNDSASSKVCGNTMAGFWSS